MDDPSDVTHYRVCVRKRDWPEWVLNRGVKASVTVDATLMPDGSEPLPLPPLDPLPEDEPLPVGEILPVGATLVLGSDEGTLLCECGRIVRDKRAFAAHRRTSRLHKELVSA